MKCSFYRPKEINIPEFDRIYADMYMDLKQLNEGELSKEDVTAYVADLIQQAKPLIKKPSMKFWGLWKPDEMPADARVMYFYFPTYVATAFLMKAVLLYPELMESENLKETLADGMLGCTGRGFEGHGYDEDFTAVDCMDIFMQSDAAVFLEKYPTLCSTFAELFYQHQDRK